MSYLAQVAVLVVALVPFVGCIHAPAPRQGGLMAAAPPTPAQLATCKAERGAHNLEVVFAGGLAGVAGAGGAAALTNDRGAQIAIGVTALASGVAAAIVGAVAGNSAGAYIMDHCPDYPEQP